MKMKSSRFFGNWYLFALALITFIFLSQMAIANPLCSNCSINLVKWALPRAELLMVGWLVAVVNESWMARSQIATLFRKLPNFLRKKRQMAPSETDRGTSQSPGASSASD